MRFSPGFAVLALQLPSVLRELVTTALLALSSASTNAHPGARPGESFTFSFSINSIEAGRARMVVGKPVLRLGRSLVGVRAQAETLPWLTLIASFNDEYTLSIDEKTLLPVELERIERGTRQRRIKTAVDGEGRQAQVSVTPPPPKGGRRDLQFVSAVRDPIAALFALRSIPSTGWAPMKFLVLDGIALWQVSLSSSHNEKLRLEHDQPGSPGHAAVRFDGMAQRLDDKGQPTKKPERHLSVWLSTDRDRALLRAETETDIGMASVELTGYQPPNRRRDGTLIELPGIQIDR